MRFKGEPNLYLFTKDLRNKRVNIVGQFDANGFFDTEDKKLINKLKVKFEVVEAAKPPETSMPFEPLPAYVCKKCGAGFETKGYLLAHHRKEHAK